MSSLLPQTVPRAVSGLGTPHFLRVPQQGLQGSLPTPTPVSILPGVSAGALLSLQKVSVGRFSGKSWDSVYFLNGLLTESQGVVVA